MTTRCRRLILALALLALLFSGNARAAEPKDYSYMFLQGKVSTPKGKQGGVEGIRVRLAGEDGQSFDAVSDRTGLFRFDRLPVQRYTMTVVAPDGSVVQSFDEIDPGDPARHKLKLQMGPSPGTSAELFAPGPEQLEVEFSERPPKWKRFWVQFGIFVGAALVLAL